MSVHLHHKTFVITNKPSLGRELARPRFHLYITIISLRAVVVIYNMFSNKQLGIALTEFRSGF